MVANEANRFWVAFYDGGVSRICVPLFMIVSTFLLVPMKPGVTMTEFYKQCAIFVNGDQANPLIPVYLAIPCIAILTFICCAVSTKLISYIPRSKYIIGA